MNDVQNENYTEKKYAFPSNIISIISSIPVLGLELDEKRAFENWFYSLAQILLVPNVPVFSSRIAKAAFYVILSNR